VAKGASHATARGRLQQLSCLVLMPTPVGCAMQVLLGLDAAERPAADGQAAAIVLPACGTQEEAAASADVGVLWALMKVLSSISSCGLRPCACHCSMLSGTIQSASPNGLHVDLCTLYTQMACAAPTGEQAAGGSALPLRPVLVHFQ
jgi:hypothetical protein